MTETERFVKLVIGNCFFSKEEGMDYLLKKYPNYEGILYVTRDKVRNYV